MTRRGIHNQHDVAARCDIVGKHWYWHGYTHGGRPAAHMCGTCALGIRITAIALGRDAERKPGQRWYAHAGGGMTGDADLTKACFYTAPSNCDYSSAKSMLLHNSIALRIASESESALSKCRTSAKLSRSSWPRRSVVPVLRNSGAMAGRWAGRFVDGFGMSAPAASGISVGCVAHIRGASRGGVWLNSLWVVGSGSDNVQTALMHSRPAQRVAVLHEFRKPLQKIGSSLDQAGVGIGFAVPIAARSLDSPHPHMPILFSILFSIRSNPRAPPALERG